MMGLAMANDRDWQRFLASCKRAYYCYTRGNDAGVVRLCKEHGISACHIRDVALTNKKPRDDFLPASELMNSTVRDIVKRGGDWKAMADDCSPILDSRTTREWENNNDV